MCITALSFAQQPKWFMYGPSSNGQGQIIDYQNQQIAGYTINYPVFMDNVQNALWGPNGEIICYAADYFLYRSNPIPSVVVHQFDKQTTTNGNNWNYGFSEFLFVPDPENCNTFYCVTVYTFEESGSSQNTRKLIYCKIYVNPQDLSVTIVPINGNNQVIIPLECVSREREDPEDPNTYMVTYASLLAATKEQANGKRLIYVSTKHCLLTFETDNGTLTQLDDFQLADAQGASPTDAFCALNIRTEMEIYEQGNQRIDVITPQYKSNPTQSDLTDGNNSFTHFEIDYTLGTPTYTLHDIIIPSIPSAHFTYIKGVEFSNDGLTLYISYATYNSQNSSVVTNGNNLIYYQRANFSSPFTYGGVISTGSTESDFAYGHIERGIDDKIYIAGDGRLGTLAQSNNPSSTWNPNSMSITNVLTEAHGFGTVNSPPNSPMDLARRRAYLIADQIDGEASINWISADQFPDRIELCVLDANNPYTFNANTAINWTVIPDQNQIGATPPYSLANQTSVSITEPGQVIAHFECYNETIDVVLSPYANYSADFNWVFINNSSSVDLTVTPLVSSGFYTHTWMLEELVNGVWTSVSTHPNIPSGMTFTGLNIMSDYRVTHMMNKNGELPPSDCLEDNYTAFDEIFTGGKIFRGSSKNTSFQNKKL